MSEILKGLSKLTREDSRLTWDRRANSSHHLPHMTKRHEADVRNKGVCVRADV